MLRLKKIAHKGLRMAFMPVSVKGIGGWEISVGWVKMTITKKQKVNKKLIIITW